MRKPNLNTVIKLLEKNNYRIFDNKEPFNVNIGAIRSADRTPDRFNDWVYIFFRDLSGEMRFHTFPATTDPGLYYLRHPLYRKGTALLAPGQYLGCWQLGFHKGKYLALVQTGAEVKVYRDANKDNRYDYRESSAEWGFFGINLHRASSWHLANYVWKFSAGCQVIQSSYDFEFLIWLCKKSKARFGNRFSFSLVGE